MLPKNTLGPKARLQPYVAYLHASYEGLRKPAATRKGVNMYDAGVNLLLDGHNAKVTLNYRARPDFAHRGMEQREVPPRNHPADAGFLVGLRHACIIHSQPFNTCLKMEQD